MARFHLHIATTAGLIDDEEGIERADLAAAQEEAIVGARSLMAADLLHGELDLGQAIRIHDDEGRELAVVRFDEAVRVVPAPANGAARPR